MDPFEEPASTREEILAAAYQALCEHGYADLTMEKIGAEFDKSVSLVYHHYDDKDDLVLSCLEFILEAFEEDFTGGVAAPEQRLEEFVGWVCAPSMEEDHREFMQLLLELRTHAGQDAEYRDHFTRSDDVFHAHLVDILEAGIESGTFEACDVDSVASTVQTLLVGVMLRRSTHDDETDWLPAVRTELERYLDRSLGR